MKMRYGSRLTVSSMAMALLWSAAGYEHHFFKAIGFIASGGGGDLGR